MPQTVIDAADGCAGARSPVGRISQTDSIIALLTEATLLGTWKYLAARCPLNLNVRG